MIQATTMKLEEDSEVEESLLEEYKKLNEKCKKTLEKLHIRKKKPNDK